MIPCPIYSVKIIKFIASIMITKVIRNNYILCICFMYYVFLIYFHTQKTSKTTQVHVKQNDLLLLQVVVYIDGKFLFEHFVPIKIFCIA